MVTRMVAASTFRSWPAMVSAGTNMCIASVPLKVTSTSSHNGAARLTSGKVAEIAVIGARDGRAARSESRAAGTWRVRGIVRQRRSPCAALRYLEVHRQPDRRLQVVGG